MWRVRGFGIWLLAALWETSFNLVRIPVRFVEMAYKTIAQDAEDSHQRMEPTHEDNAPELYPNLQKKRPLPQEGDEDDHYDNLPNKKDIR